VSCPVNNLAFVIPSEAKESLCEIAASLKILAMTMYKSFRDMTIEYSKLKWLISDETAKRLEV
jgi:hypothetical protein